MYGARGRGPPRLRPHWRGPSGREVDGPYVHKRFRCADFVTDGHDYWFHRGALEPSGCAALALLDLLNAHVDEPFRELCTTTVHPDAAGLRRADPDDRQGGGRPRRQDPRGRGCRGCRAPGGAGSRPRSGPRSRMARQHASSAYLQDPLVSFAPELEDSSCSTSTSPGSSILWGYSAGFSHHSIPHRRTDFVREGTLGMRVREPARVRTAPDPSQRTDLARPHGREPIRPPCARAPRPAGEDHDAQLSALLPAWRRGETSSDGTDRFRLHAETSR